MILKKYFLFILIISIIGVFYPVNGEVFAAELNLVQLARMSVEAYLQGKSLDFDDIRLRNDFNDKVIGVFVTILDSDNRSRGCWGNLHIQTSLKEAVIISAVGAIKKDYRFSPPTLSDLSDMKFQVSLVSRIVPVSSLREINPLRDGLLVKSASKGGIIMPGEAVDAYYQMVQCKLKANIRPGEHYDLFKLVTKVYKE